MLLVANSFSRRLMQMWAICQAFCWESWSHKQWANSLWILTHTLHRQEKFAFSPKVYFALPPFPSSPRPPHAPSTARHPALSQPTGTRQASSWWLWWYSQGERPREALLLKLTEVGMQDLLNYLNRQMLHSVHFLTSSYFSKNWHSPMALHIRTLHGFHPFMTGPFQISWEHCPQLASEPLSYWQMGVLSRMYQASRHCRSPHIWNQVCSPTFK